MPVIVPKDKEALWMDPGAPDPRELAAILLLRQLNISNHDRRMQ
jgi:hypothetical protein